MTVEIRVLQKPKILEVTYTTERVTSTDLEEQRRLVAEALSKHDLRKVLIDASSLEQVPAILTMFEHNTAVSSDKILQRSIFAVVFRSIGSNERFLETSGSNRGVRIKCFTSRDEALTWLSN